MPDDSNSQPQYTREFVRQVVKESALDWLDVKGQDTPSPPVNFDGIGNMAAQRLEGKTREEVRETLRANIAPPPPPVTGGWVQKPIQPTPPNDSWRNARGTYLYSGNREEVGITEFWLAASRFISWGRLKRARYLETQKGNTHIVIAFNTGTRSALRETPFDCLASEFTRQKTLEAIRQAIAAGFQVWGYLMTQEFGEQALGWNEAKVIDRMTRTMRLVAPLVHIVTPFREIGDIYHGDDAGLTTRNAILAAIREASEEVCIAVHERSLEGIPLSDFGRDNHGGALKLTKITGPTASALQVGFDTPTDYAAEFMRSNVQRMSKVPDHVVVYFEGSIPPNVYETPGPRRRTLADAKARARRIMEESGAHGNMDAA